MPSDESERVDDLKPITAKEKPVNNPLPAQGTEIIEPFAVDVDIKEVIEEVIVVNRE